MINQQLTDKILMIQPFVFGYNSSTALDNVYQHAFKVGLSKSDIAKKASLEFQAFVDVLRDAGVTVFQFEDSGKEYTPDSIFPNNWITTHSDGSIWLYPMFSKNRRKERRRDILNYLENNFNVSAIFDSSEYYENKNQFLEGTGSIVLDRENKIGYASISKRTDERLFVQWCEKMNFKPVSFVSIDREKPIYHTNVLMSICETMVFICLDAVVEDEKKSELISLFSETKKQIINITKDQMHNFLGNVLQLKNSDNESYLVMSSNAFNILTDTQKKIISNTTKILHSPLDTIEYFGGGSARCMIAELFLEPNSSFNAKKSLFL